MALFPIYEDSPVQCSKKAVVSAIGRDPVRNVAVVLAEEVDTQMIVRVDVILDVIKSLKISTTTREVIMNEVPERFQVVAFDSQGTFCAPISNSTTLNLFFVLVSLRLSFVTDVRHHISCCNVFLLLL